MLGERYMRQFLQDFVRYAQLKELFQEMLLKQQTHGRKND